MRIFMTLGSAPSAPDRRAGVVAGETDMLISFYDHPKAFTTLADLAHKLLEPLPNQPKEDPHEH